MKRVMFLGIFIAVLTSSCLSNLGRGFKIKSSSKPNSISRDYSTKNYFSAFTSAVNAIEKKQPEEKKNEALSIIQDAYSKYLEEEESMIEYLIKSQNDKDYSRLNLENNATSTTYKRSIELQWNYEFFQKELKRITPLYYEGKELIFPLKDYSGLIARAKDKYSDFLLRAAKSHTEGLKNSLSQDEKGGYREAYKIYVLLQKFDSGYKKAEVIKAKEEAYKKGQSYINIQFNNSLKNYKNTDKDLLASLDFGRWITIGKDARGKYDFNFVVAIENFDVSKGDIQRTVFEKEKEIVIQENQTGRDRRPVVVSRNRVLRSRLEIIDMHKEATIIGTIKTTDNYTQKTRTGTIEVPGTFMYSYAIQNGDIRAIDPEYLPLLEKAPSALPTDSEMFKISLKSFSEKLESKIINEAFSNN